MKLLFYVNNFAMAGSGLENDAVLLCRALGERGHEVHVCCRHGDAVDGITVHVAPHDEDNLLCDVSPDKTIDWGFVHNADVHRIGGGIHEMYMDYSLKAFSGLGRIMKRLSYGGAKHRRIIEQEREYIRDPATLLLPISRMVADHAILAGAAPAAVKVVYNGVDCTKFEPVFARRKRAEIRSAWGLDDDDVAYLFVAHNLKLKNLDLMINCLRRLRNPKLKLIVCGKRKPRMKAPFLHYAGTTADMASFYGAADVLVHPSFYDSFANVVLEAMACSVPAVVSDCSGVIELLEHGKDATVLPVFGNRVCEKWCEAITHLADLAIRRKLAPVVRATAEANPFSKHVDSFESALLTE